MSQEIPNEQLTFDVIPVRGAGWSAIAAFAATFDAYTYWMEPWEHSDWSQGIPIAEYEEMVRRQGQPAQRVEQVFMAVLDSKVRAGNWDATLTKLRTYLFACWRAQRYDGTAPEDLMEFYDLLDAIRARVESGERE